MVEWLKDLPKAVSIPTQRKYDWEGIASALRSMPGEWAVVARDVPRTHAAMIRSGRYRAFRPPDHYEVTTVGPAGNRADLYMVYIGAPGAKLKANEGDPRRVRSEADG